MRLADTDRLGAEAGGEVADRIAFEQIAAAQTGAGGQPVLHRIGDEFRPAFTPQIASHFGAVGEGNQTADLLGALGDAAMHLAGTKHGMCRAVLGGAAMNMAGLRQIDSDRTSDAAERLAPADDAGDGFLVHAILQRHDEGVGRQILADQHRGPGGVVGLHADESDIDRRLLGELLRVGDVQRAHRHGEFRLLHGVGHAQAVLAHVFDMLGPGIDEGHVFARSHHVGARIATDGAGSDEGDFLLTHPQFYPDTTRHGPKTHAAENPCRPKHMQPKTHAAQNKPPRRAMPRHSILGRRLRTADKHDTLV